MRLVELVVGRRQRLVRKQRLVRMQRLVRRRAGSGLRRQRRVGIDLGSAFVLVLCVLP